MVVRFAELHSCSYRLVVMHQHQDCNNASRARLSKASLKLGGVQIGLLAFAKTAPFGCLILLPKTFSWTWKWESVAQLSLRPHFASAHY